MRHGTRQTAMLAGLAGGAVFMAQVGGCASSVADRSAADAASTQPAQSRVLEFFDELERRPAACQDDLLQGMLLVRTGTAPADHAGRVAQARKLGIVDAGYAAPALGPVTVEQASAAAARTLGSRDYAKWDRGATKWAQTEGLVPAEADPNSQMTGGQLLAVLGGVSDMLATRPAASTDMASAASTDAFDQFTPVATTPANPAPATPAATAEQPKRLTPEPPPSAPMPRPEPLPEMKLVEQPKAAPPPPPPTPPVAPAPAPVVAKAPEPAAKPAEPAPVVAKAEPKPEPVVPAKPIEVPKPKTNPWSSGKPLGGKN